jgi:ankyrin repeat protein
MPEALPARPDLDWYRKSAKQRLRELRAADSAATLAAAQLAVAREHGFASWRELKLRVDLADGLLRLFAAIRARDHGEVRKLLDANPALARLPDADGQNALHLAAEVNDPDSIDLLVRHKANLGAYYGKGGHNALSWALTTGARTAAHALLRHGLEPDFFCAAGLGDLERVRAFFDASGKLAPNASRTGSSRWRPDGTRLPAPPPTARERISDALYFASRNGQVGVVRELLEHDPDLGFRAFIGGTPLHWAYYGGSHDVVALLLGAGADPSLRDYEYGCTPHAFGICVAASWGFPSLLERALQMDPSSVNILEGRGTPLHEAARAGHSRLVDALLAAGANPEIRDADGKTPLDLARAEAQHETAELLRSRGRAAGTERDA